MLKFFRIESADQPISNRAQAEDFDEALSDDETVEQKRLRLAKDLIEQVRAESILLYFFSI